MLPGYGLDDGEVQVGVPVRSRTFPSAYRPHRFWGVLSLLFERLPGDIFLGIKLPARETANSSTNAEVTKTWICPYTPMAQCSAEHRKNFTFTTHCKPRYVLHGSVLRVQYVRFITWELRLYRFCVTKETPNRKSACR
jgi:hypothetical protein